MLSHLEYFHTIWCLRSTLAHSAFLCRHQ